MNLTQKQILLPAVSAIAGGLIVFGTTMLIPSLNPKNEQKHDTTENAETFSDDVFKIRNGLKSRFESIFSEDIFRQGDPFEQINKIRQQMEREVDQMYTSRTGSPLDPWFSDKFGRGTITDISKREDDESVYYDIEVEDVNSTSIGTQVENGYITITGVTQKKSGTSNEQSNDGISAQKIYKSTFQKTFPLPDQVTQNKMQILSEKDKIILKFPKIKST